MVEKEKRKKLADEWFRKAHSDQEAVEDILKGGRSFSTVCFLCQQTAEKYLKGFLVYSGQEFPKIHDLVALLNKCKNIDMGFKIFQEDMIVLNDYYIASRYPGGWQEDFSKNEAEQALKKTIRLKNFVIKLIAK